MEANKLNEILRKHEMWFNNEEGGERADLIGADLSEANLRGADLIGAKLYGADLRCADLSEANLRCAKLYGADLRCADLKWADLIGADLSEANLRGVDLREADLRGANLYGADLRCADLRGAKLYGADLSGADLSGADIECPIACPEKGSFIAFKKAFLYGVGLNYCIVELLIPEDAKRSSATTRKCRCNRAKVLSITNLDGTDTMFTKGKSKYDSNFIYEIGKTVEVENFDDNRWNECAPGIHFFITRQEAVDY